MKKQKTVSIKAKLLGVIIPVVIAIVVVLVVVAYQISAGIIKKYSQNLLQSSVENQASQIEAWLNENLASFQMAKTTIENLKPDDEELKTILDSYYGYNSNYPDGLYVADSAGQLITASESTKKESDVTNSTWYKEGLSRVNMAVGSAYQNADGVDVISASGILNDGSDKVRVISADMTLDRIAIIVNSFIEMNDAEAFLVDKTSGVILANRDSSLISQTLGAEGQSHFYQLTAEKVADKDYNFVTLDGNMTVFQEVEGTNWLLVSYIPTSIVLSDLTQLRNIMIVISVICIALLCVLIERVTHVVIKPVKEMTRVIAAMTSGDFTVSIKTKGNDEIAVMSHSVEKFIVSMKQMISEMGNVSGKLKNQADSSKGVSGEMSSAAGIQSQSMSELNATVDQLSVSVNEIAENATQLAGVAADTKSDSDMVESKMQETVAVSEKGRKDMERVGEALSNIEVSIHNLEEAVNKVGTASGEIVQIIKLIGDIADETNLLSLNASIEAARAGEAGRGFAVVAAEIGTLAKNSADSVAHITELITEINTLVEDAVRQAGNSAQDISGSAELIHTAVDTFDTIFKNIQETSTLIGNVVDKINQVDQVATNVAAISEEQAASSDEILATSESMLQQAKNISKNSDQVEQEADNLAVSADQLADQVKQFRI
ncbi:methyl-accepting chemotaxis protein [Roseburia sp. OF03-24]|jgi:methyl-accepting chemotaxis protein|uniref:methyl-accepting chemotaxis protein n=1 Tax=Roseburia sp. OF03-24 TaxID=2292367 RepID=UPI000E4771E1|nr:methyl-accepting chemotaxis protein [Roseburia sp. OF03-24]RGX89669.1 methyl-accepting chemotaxis protein [Roseburia sp. OF03-24]